MEEERTITLDLGSSPDPLIDPVLSPPMVPPSHITRKSPAAERLFTALAPSPRKQTFELDVGNERTPQRLLVTVEAGDEGARSTSRRLFQSPTPKQRRVTPRRATAVTTTTVPLRGLSDDEGLGIASATPKRRGRPRKSSTPAPARRKRPGTPAKGRKSSGARASASPTKDVLASDIGLEATPRPPAQPKSAKRKATSPAKEDGSAPGSQPRKRGRPRKKTMDTEGVARLGQDAAAEHPILDTGPLAPPSQAGDDMEDDIWLATMSDQPTPAPQKKSSREPELPTSRSQHVDSGTQPPPQQADSHFYDWPDMGGGADSDAGSLSSDDDGRDGFEDTIMAEEFTMISIGSLPSMQPNSSVMAPAHEELGEATSLIINGALESLRQSQNRPAEQASAELPALPDTQPSIEIAAESRSQLPQPPLLPPPSPQTGRQSPRRSPRRTTAQPLARQLAQRSLQQQQQQQQRDQSPAPPQPPAQAEAQDSSAYEDSFSEIPEAILAAATPRRYRPPQAQAEEPDRDIQPSIERPSLVNHSNPQTETNRPLTPDETPSPVPSDADNAAPQPEPPAPETDLPSSPPVDGPVHLSDATARHVRHNSTETPADQLASFTSSNMGVRDPQPVHLPVPDSQPRPSLSPIVRAGRALQLVTSDPPSPPGRDSLLGSPFRGSVPKSSQSPAPMPPAAPEQAEARASRSPSQQRTDAPTQSPSRSWLAPLNQMRDFIVRSAQSLSPTRVSAPEKDRIDDPFGPDPGELAGSGAVRTTLFSGHRRQGPDRDAAVAVAGPAGAGPARDDDAMSWRGESPVGETHAARPVSGGADTGVLVGVDEAQPGDYESPVSRAALPMPGESEAQLRGSVPPVQEAPSVTAAEAAPPQAGLGQQAEAQEEQREEEDDDEEDIWAIEAQRPTPYVPRHAALRQEPAVEPRRGRLASTRRQDIRRRLYGGESGRYTERNAPAETSAPTNEEGSGTAARDRVRQVPVRFERNEPRNEEDDFSLLSQRRDRPSPPAPANRLTKKPDLSAFFSSPAVLPDMPEAPGAGLVSTRDSQALEQARPPTTRPRPAPAQRPQAPGSGLFSQYLESQAENQPASVPQEQPGIGHRQRSAGLFSPVRQSVERSSPERVAEPVSQSVSPEVPELTPLPAPQKLDFMSRRQQSAESTARAASPESPEQVSSPVPIPQKMNFTPRRRSSRNTLFEPKSPAPTTSLFGNSQVAAFFSWSRPRPQRPRARPDQQEAEVEEPTPAMSPPKPLPNRAVSPGKSCIRSPLKPKTPGRVVEFTSSTLSPLEQAQARAERRAGASPAKENGVGAAQSGRGRVDAVRGVEHDEGGHSASSAPPSLSLSPSPSPEPSLSPSPSPSPSPRRDQRPRYPRSAPTSSTAAHSRPSRQQRQDQVQDQQHQQHQRRQNHHHHDQQQQQQQQQQQPREPQEHTQPLSPTTWTRAHWLRLDELLQARRRGPRTFGRELARGRGRAPSSSSSSSPPLPSRGTWRHLVGKRVRAQGESVVLEAWHVDVVEGFLSELSLPLRGEAGEEEAGGERRFGGGRDDGGVRRRVRGGPGAGRGTDGGGEAWDGVEIVRRVFALLVGGERRRLGLVPALREGVRRPAGLNGALEGDDEVF